MIHYLILTFLPFGRTAFLAGAEAGFAGAAAGFASPGFTTFALRSDFLCQNSWRFSNN